MTTVFPTDSSRIVRVVGGDIFDAAQRGSLELTEALLATPSVDVDARADDGATPLIVAGQGGHASVVRAMLGGGAGVDLACHTGWTALMASSQRGHLAVVRLLAGAGADLDAKDRDGDSALNAASVNGHAAVVEFLAAAGAETESPDADTACPLHNASREGHVAVVKALLAAGAEMDCLTAVGETPLLLASAAGQLGVVRALLRAGADPARPMILPTGKEFVALDAAAQQGHRKIVRELLARVGLEACGGPRGGVVGLCLAAQQENLGMMAVLRDGGVMDTGKALFDSCNQGREASVRFLLRQDWGIPGSTYASARNDLGYTPLWLGAAVGSVRIVRLLLDAGADETVACENTTPFRFEGHQVTPLGFAVDCIRQRNYRCRFATDEQMERMEGVRRLLVRVDAVRARSWLWRTGVFSTAAVVVRPPAEEADGDTCDDERWSTAALSVPIVRDRRRAAVTAFFRYSNKP